MKSEHDAQKSIFECREETSSSENATLTSLQAKSGQRELELTLMARRTSWPIVDRPPRVAAPKCNAISGDRGFPGTVRVTVAAPALAS